MPGAISRTTGSATRWNSFQPLFMRNGRVQPLRVTTGLYGRPALGASGGAVAGPGATAASGTAPIAARLTPAALSSTPAPARKLRREFIGVPRVQWPLAPPAAGKAESIAGAAAG